MSLGCLVSVYVLVRCDDVQGNRGMVSLLTFKVAALAHVRRAMRVKPRESMAELCTVLAGIGGQIRDHTTDEQWPDPFATTYLDSGASLLSVG